MEAAESLIMVLLWKILLAVSSRKHTSSSYVLRDRTAYWVRPRALRVLLAPAVCLWGSFSSVQWAP